MDKILFGVVTAALWFALCYAAHAAGICANGCRPAAPVFCENTVATEVAAECSCSLS